ncbi:hypothetical protein Syun_004147 [Stephania yunnanensis]|uniref:Uncharacterized protein n=1 Tax=Stephania yunnanensis TaxID=152371 RepID=A0AAP0L513_9MAGN
MGKRDESRHLKTSLPPSADLHVIFDCSLLLHYMCKTPIPNPPHTHTHTHISASPS